MDHHNFNDTEEWPELVACNKSVELPYPVVEIDVSFGSDSPPIQVKHATGQIRRIYIPRTRVM